jgi:FKBP-type peptidyl-prolyl cis-trans isomerase SlyD
MKVKKNCLVRVHFKVTDDEGIEIDASSSDAPLEFVCGRGDVVTGLERGVIGLEPGAKKRITVSPNDGYGERNPAHVKVLPRAAFPVHLPLVEGTRFSYRAEKGAEVMYRVQEIRADSIVADYNHPLAGKTLHYDVTVLDVTDDFVDG